MKTHTANLTRRTAIALVGLASLVHGCENKDSISGQYDLSTPTSEISKDDSYERSTSECLELLNLKLYEPYTFTLNSGEKAILDLNKDIYKGMPRVRLRIGEQVILQSAATNIQTGRASLDQVFIADENGNVIKYEKNDTPDYERWQKAYEDALHQALASKERPIREALELVEEATRQLPEKIERP